MRNNFAGTIALCMFVALMTPFRATANLILNSTYAWNGTSPTGPSPWLTADFVDGKNHTLTLTLTALHLSTNKGNLEDVQDWFFNLDPTLTPSDVKFTFVSQTGGFTDPTITATTQNAQTTQANVKFDVDFGYATGNPKNRFTQGDSITYTITDSKDPTFSSAVFDFSTSSNGSGPDPLYDSAHIQNTGSNGNGSGDIGAITAITQSVPEPASLSLLGIAMAGLLVRGGRSN